MTTAATAPISAKQSIKEFILGHKERAFVFKNLKLFSASEGADTSSDLLLKDSSLFSDPRVAMSRCPSLVQSYFPGGPSPETMSVRSATEMLSAPAEEFFPADARVTCLA